MGYSCTTAALMTLAAVVELHPGEGTTGFTTPKGRFFFEHGQENEDGRITGTVQKLIGTDRARRAGTFRIDPDGTVNHFDGLPRKFWPAIQRKGRTGDFARKPVI